MEAKELMIGDWVQHIDGYFLQVGTITDKGLVGCSKEFIGEDYMIRPIPLTPEILEKNGFVKQNFDGWEYIHPDDSNFSYIDYRILWRTDYDNHLFIKKYKGGNSSATLQISCINYIHQLQHALRLCGINHEIIL